MSWRTTTRRMRREASYIEAPDPVKRALEEGADRIDTLEAALMQSTTMLHRTTDTIRQLRDARPGNDAGCANVEIESGVNQAGEPFCRVIVLLEDGTEHLGQIDPAEARRMALNWLQVAEAAVSDAAVYKLLTTTLEVEPDTATFFVCQLRTTRIDMPSVQG